MKINFFHFRSHEEADEYHEKRHRLWKKYFGKAKLVEKGSPWSFGLGEKKNGSPNHWTGGPTREEFEQWVAEKAELAARESARTLLKK